MAGVDSISNRNEYQESFWRAKGSGKADNLTAIYEPTVQKMWELRPLTALWAFAACYWDSFTFILFYMVS
jgi:L-amino acid N-acyltransferase YncA